MRFLLPKVIIVLLTFTTAKAQTLPDSQFQWFKNSNCYPKENNTEIFLKVEQDPVITQFNINDFDSLISKTIQNLKLNEDQSGMIKLKLLFAKNQNLCVIQIGTKTIELSELQLNEITKTLNSINQFNNGKQRDIEVNCQGILYINIINGKVTKTRNVNFNILL